MNYSSQSTIDTNSRLVFGVATSQVINKKGQLVDIAQTTPYFQDFVYDGGRVLFGHNSECEVGQVVHFSVHADPVPTIAVVLRIDSERAWELCMGGQYGSLSMGGDFVRLGRERLQAMEVERIVLLPDEVSITDDPVCPDARIHVFYDKGRWIRPGHGNKEVKRVHS